MKKYLIALSSIVALSSIALSSCNVGNISSIVPTNNVSLMPNFSTYSNTKIKNILVEIKLNRKEQLNILNEQDFDLYGYNKKNKTIRAIITEKQQQFLENNGFNFTFIRESNAQGSGLLPGYRTYQDVKDYLMKLQNDYPNIVTVKDVGDTVLKIKQNAVNNDIWLISITNKQVKKQKSACLFISGVHPRELAPVEINLKFIDELVSKYGKDPEITKLIDTRQIDIVPIVNVDGRIMVEKGNTWQRENANGVDLNRNFDCKYLPNLPPDRSMGIFSSSSKQEPETIAIQDLYKTTKYNLFMDIHAYGEMFFWPVGYSTKDIPDVAPFKRVYENTFKKIGYDGGTSAQILYPTIGTSDDYAYIKHHAFGLGMEVGNSFRPSYEQVNKMWNDIRPNFLYLVKITDAPFAQ